MGKKSISDAGQRLKAMNDALAGFDQMRAEIDRLQAEIELLRGYRDEAEAEASIASLAAQRLRLTDAEREAVEFFGTMQWPKESQQIKSRAATLRGLLERTEGGGT